MGFLVSWLGHWGNAGAVANVQADLDVDRARVTSVAVLARRVAAHAREAS
jgi:hypothetical protein